VQFVIAKQRKRHKFNTYGKSESHSICLGDENRREGKDRKVDRHKLQLRLYTIVYVRIAAKYVKPN